MNTSVDSSLSNKRIVISLLLGASIPILAKLMNIYVKQKEISLMASFNVIGCILMMYDWNLFGIHYNRSKKDMRTTVLYTIIGILFIGLLVTLNSNFFHALLIIPKEITLTSYGYARPAMLLGYSFVQSFLVNILYKCLTDKCTVQGKELQTILITSFVFGFAYLIAFIPFSPMVWFRTYLYNLLLIAIMSYLYNQSHSLVPGCLAMGFVYLLCMFL